MPLCDLSHAVEDGMVTYRGLPAPVVCDFLSREASREIYATATPTARTLPSCHWSRSRGGRPL